MPSRVVRSPLGPLAVVEGALEERPEDRGFAHRPVQGNRLIQDGDLFRGHAWHVDRGEEPAVGARGVLVGD